MLLKRINLLLIFLTLFIFISCKQEGPAGSSFVVIGISADVESINPLFTFSQEEVKIAELLYLPLIRHEWDDVTGDLNPVPMIAERWEWNSDSTSLILYLRDDVFWSDGAKFTSDDVIFSFDVYSDPAVQSRLFGTHTNFIADQNLRIMVDTTFMGTGPFKVVIQFKENSAPSLFDVDFPILPKHVYENIPRKDLITVEKTIPHVTNGPFKLDNWEKNQSISLSAYERFIYYDNQNISGLIFKIVPDYSSRLTQLRTGEIDMAEDIHPADVDQLLKLNHLSTAPVEGREYDYIGWNNISPAEFKKGEIVPHELFGDAVVRQALTAAINRFEIKEENLGEFGEVAFGPVAPIFQSAFNDSLQPEEYSPEKAKQLFAQAGWRDIDNDGVIEKGNKEFSFTLNIPSGNPRRSFAASVVKNNLKIAGVNVSVLEHEPGVFFEQMFNKEFDAWMAGWSVPIPPNPKPYWHSSLDENYLNVVSYRNTRADNILNQYESESSHERKSELLKELQEIFYEDKPVTFLYWIDNIVVYNNRIKNIKVTPLGPLHYCWSWKTIE